jgi:hypothetical protein
MAQNTEQALERVADAYEGIDEVLDGLIEDSEKYSDTIRERIRWVEKEVSLQQRNARIDNQERKGKLDYERRIGMEKGQWSKKDEEMYRRKKGWLDQERRDESLYYEKMRSRLQEKGGGMGGGRNGGRGGRGGNGGLGDRFSQYLHDAGRMDRGLPPSDGGDDDGSGGSGSGGGRRGIGARIAGGFRAAGNGALAAAGFGAVLSIAGFVGKMIDEAKQLDQNRKKLSGMTGSSGMGGAAYGLKEAEVMEYTRNVSMLRGKSSMKEARAQLGMEKGFGMDIGSTNQFNKVMRLDEHSTLTDATVDMLNIMKKSDLYNIKRNDFSQLHELMERQNNLNELQASQEEEVSARESSLLMSAFGKVGGSFGDFRQTDTIGKMNNAIVNPGNDFKQAFLYRTLHQQNPGGTFLDLKMKQEEGIFGKGTLGGVMDNLSKTFSGDQLTFSMSKMLGLNLHQSKKLQGYYAQNPDAFKDLSFSSDSDFKDFIENGQTKKEKSSNWSRKKMAGRGAAHTGAIEGWSSEFDTWMGRQGDKAVQYVKELQGAYQKDGFSGVMSKIGGDIVDAIKKGFSEVYNTLTGKDANSVAANSLYGNKEVQEDVTKALSKMSEEDFAKYEEAILSNGGMTKKGGKVIDVGSPEEHEKYVSAVRTILKTYMSEKYKDIDDEGKVIKVHVVNQPNKTPKNTTHKQGDN